MANEQLAGELEQLREAAGFLAVAARPEDCMKAMKSLAVHLDTHWDTIIAALRTDDRTTEPWEDEVERVASAIHDARFGPDWPETLAKDTLAETDRSGREYCYRLARAALASITPDRIRGEAFEEAARAMKAAADDGCGFDGMYDAIIELKRVVR